jgi:hypothetical protein
LSDSIKRDAVELRAKLSTCILSGDGSGVEVPTDSIDTGLGTTAGECGCAILVEVATKKRIHEISFLFMDLK